MVILLRQGPDPSECHDCFISKLCIFFNSNAEFNVNCLGCEYCFFVHLKELYVYLNDLHCERQEMFWKFCVCFEKN